MRSGVVPPSCRKLADLRDKAGAPGGAPARPGLRGPDTVPMWRACSWRATDRAVRRGISRGFCTGRAPATEVERDARLAGGLAGARIDVHDHLADGALVGEVLALPCRAQAPPASASIRAVTSSTRKGPRRLHGLLRGSQGADRKEAACLFGCRLDPIGQERRKSRLSDDLIHARRRCCGRARGRPVQCGRTRTHTSAGRAPGCRREAGRCRAHPRSTA